jgi:hypothetical protein
MLRTIFVSLVLLILSITACSNGYTDDEVQEIVDKAVKEALMDAQDSQVSDRIFLETISIDVFDKPYYCDLHDLKPHAHKFGGTMERATCAIIG